MKYVAEMDHLQNQIILTSYLPQKEKFRMQLEITRTKKELDYSRYCEVKSEIATLNYYLDELDVASNRLIEAVELVDE